MSVDLFKLVMGWLLVVAITLIGIIIWATWAITRITTSC